MKRYYYILAFALFAMAFCSCGSTQNVTTTPQADGPDGVELKTPKSQQLAEEKPAVRAFGKGVSADEGFARQQAEADARRQMSNNIDAAIIAAARKIGFDIKQHSGGDEDGMSVNDGAVKQNSFLQSITSNIVASTMVIKTDRFYNAKNRLYTVYVCVEYNGDAKEISKDITKKVRNAVSDSDRAKIDAENEQFMQEINSFLNKSNVEQQ